MNETYNHFLEQLEGEAWSAGYDMSGDTIYNVKLFAREDLWPEILLYTEEYNGRDYVMPLVKPPSISAADVDYADSIEYYLRRWYETVGKFCTWLLNDPQNPDSYYVEDEEE